MTKKESFLPILSAIMTSIIFGLSFLFSKKALSVASPIELLSFRFMAAFLVMSLLIGVRVIRVNYKGKKLINLIFLGIMQPIVYFIFETYGIKYSSSSQAGLMIALIPIAVTLLGAYILKEKPTVLQCAFIICSVGGVALIGVMNGTGKGGGNLSGILLLLGAVISAAIYNILSRKLSTEFTSMEMTYFMMGIGAIFFNAVSIADRAGSSRLSSYFAPFADRDFVIAIIYLGILSSIIAFFLVNFTLSKIEASKSATLANLTTIVSIVAGVLILKEKFEYYHFIGSVMILAGVWGTNHFGHKTDSSLAAKS